MLTRHFHDKDDEISRSFINFKNSVSDFLKVFHEYSDLKSYNTGDETIELYETRKFYKIREWNPDLYHELLNKYNYHCLLLEDLLIEVTRAINYVLTTIRTEINPNFFIDNGLLIIEIGPFLDLSTHIVRPEYTDENTSELYPGLRKFMENRNNRNYVRGSGVSEDYFKKFP